MQINLLVFYHDAIKNAAEKKEKVTRTYFIEYALTAYKYIYSISFEVADLCFAATKYKEKGPHHLYSEIVNALGQINLRAVGEREHAPDDGFKNEVIFGI